MQAQAPAGPTGALHDLLQHAAIDPNESVRQAAVRALAIGWSDE